MKLFITLILFLSSSVSLAGNVSVDEVRQIKFYECGYTDAGDDDVDAKFSMTPEREDGTRGLVSTRNDAGKEFATCENTDKGIKCKYKGFWSFFKTAVFSFEKLYYSEEDGYSIKSTDHDYQCYYGFDPNRN